MKSLLKLITAFLTFTLLLKNDCHAGPGEPGSDELRQSGNVPVKFHLMNSHMDPDSAASLINIVAMMPGGLSRSVYIPITIWHITDTTFTLNGYGNVQNAITVSLVNSGTELYQHVQLINKGDSIKVDVNY